MELNKPKELSLFSEANKKRMEHTFKCGDKPNTYWATALAEEVGEIAGIVKKLDRGFNEREKLKAKKRWDKVFGADPTAIQPTDYDLKLVWETELTSKLSDEMADLFTYLDLMATVNGVDLWEAIIRKFNLVSKEMNHNE